MPIDPNVKSLHDHLKSTNTGAAKLTLVRSCATVSAAIVALHDQHPGTYAKACEFLEADPETAYVDAKHDEDERLAELKRRRDAEMKRAEADRKAREERQDPKTPPKDPHKDPSKDAPKDQPKGDQKPAGDQGKGS